MAGHTWVIRVLGLLFVSGMAVSVGSCGENEKPGGDTPKIAFVVPNTTLSFAKEMSEGFATGVDQVGGVEHAVAGPPSVDGPAQVAMFEEAVKDATGGVALFTLTPDLFTQSLRDAADGGVPLVALDNQLAHGSPVELLVANDNHELGGQLAEQIIKQLPANPRGSVIIGSSTPQAAVLNQRAAGMRDKFHDLLPKIEVLGPFDTKQDVVANLGAWNALAAANEDALAFLGTGDADGWNLADIRRRSKATWAAGAFDVDNRSLQAVAEGDLTLVSPEHFVKGAVAGRLMARNAKDGAALPKGWLYTPGLVITKANIADVVLRQRSLENRARWFKARIDEVIDTPDRFLRPLSALPG
jgi:ribose transport system substrate-binding protein